MRSSELVKLSSDTDFIPSKWQVVEATIGADAASTKLWLKRVAYGVDTLDNLKKILNEYYYKLSEFHLEFGDEATRSGIQQEGLRAMTGPIFEYRVESLSNVVVYSRPNFNGVPPVDIG